MDDCWQSELILWLREKGNLYRLDDECLARVFVALREKKPSRALEIIKTQACETFLPEILKTLESIKDAPYGTTDAAGQGHVADHDPNVESDLRKAYLIELRAGHKSRYQLLGEVLHTLKYPLPTSLQSFYSLLREFEIRSNYDLLPSLPDNSRSPIPWQKMETLPDEDFLYTAYRLLTGREPDPGGYNYYLTSLNSGRMARVDVIGSLRYSTEGRSHNANIQGVFLLYQLGRIARKLKIFGIPLRWFLRIYTFPGRFAAIMESLRSVRSSIATISHLLELARRQENLLVEEAIHQAFSPIARETKKDTSLPNLPEQFVHRKDESMSSVRKETITQATTSHFQEMRTLPPRKAYQLLETFVEGDAIGNHDRFLHNLLLQMGFDSRFLVDGFVSPALRSSSVYRRRSHKPSDDSLLIYHHSIGENFAQLIANHSGKKILIYHNITPASFFEETQPLLARRLQSGRQILRQLSNHFQISVSDSAYNGEELLQNGFSNVHVIPIAVDPISTLARPDPLFMERLGDGKFNVLFVGRVTPGKRQDLFAELFFHLRSAIPLSRLILAGEVVDPLYFVRKVLPAFEKYRLYSGNERRQLFDPSGSIFMPGKVTDGQLHAVYESADLYLSLSEHEGLGLPLVEAMCFDIPVFARDAGAVSETLGNGGVLIPPDSNPEKIVELILNTIGDAKKREDILNSQRIERARFHPEKIRGAWMELLLEC